MFLYTIGRKINVTYTELLQQCKKSRSNFVVKYSQTFINTCILCIIDWEHAKTNNQKIDILRYLI
jgi:hypothetical protein